MKLKKIIPCALLCAYAGVLIAFPDKYIKTCFQGICLWGECVLPSLFPFMVITLLLIKSGAPQAAAKPFAKACRKLKLPTAALPLFIMSAISGYPAGSRILSEYYECGLIDSAQAKKLAPLCSTCGPLFALGTVGIKAFGGKGDGIKLLCACLISVMVSSLAISFFIKDSYTPQSLNPKKRSDENPLYASFYGAVNASLVAGAFIAFFYTLSKIFADFQIFKPLEYPLSLLFGKNLSAGLCSGLCEATGGCFALGSEGGFFALPLAGFLTTFGGASIISQQLCYLLKCKVKAGYFIAVKAVQGVICFALLCLFSLI